MSEPWRPALDFLAAHHTVSLGLVHDGAPHACNLLYAHHGFTLMWVSDPRSRHSQAIDRDAGAGTPAAATIAPDYADFRLIRGLQMHGRAQRIEGLGDLARTMMLLKHRYDFLANFLAGPAALAAAMAKARLYRFVPEAVTFVDNTAGFGHKTVLTPADLAAAEA